MKYLLPCECGHETPISPSQAGNAVVCECGKRLDIPTLRQLRELKQAGSEAGEKAKTDWSLRQGLLATGLIFAAALAGVGGYWWAIEPPPPREFDPLATEQAVDQNLAEMTPANSYRQWVTYYEKLEQISKVEHPHDAALRASIERHQTVRWSFLGAAAVVAVLSLLAPLLVPGKRS